MSGRGLRLLCRWSCLGLLALLTPLSAAQRVHAQQTPEQQTPAQETADTPAAGQQGDKLPAERIIYVPFRQLEDVLEKQDASVVIPYADYLQLWTRPDAAPGADVSAVITRADYQARVEEDIARITAELTIEVVGRPWVEVPLNFGEAAVADVSSETGEVLLQGTGEGTYVLLLKETGRQQVTLELTTRVVTSPEGRQIEFSTPSVAISTLELTVPQADQVIEVRPRLIQSPVPPGDEAQQGVTHIRASLGSTGKVTARWHPRAGDRPQMELLANVTNLQRIRIADGLVHTDATLQYSVLRGELEQLRITLPADQRVLDVTASARISRWQTSEQDGAQILTVDLLAPATGNLTLEVHTEAKLGEGPLQVAGIDESGAPHGVHALDVVRESGQLVVSHSGELTLRVVDQSGLVRIEAGEVAEKIRQEGALAYKYFNPQFTLQLAVAAVEPRVTLVHAAQVHIGEEDVRLSANLNYTIERAGLFELRLRVPDGLENVRVESQQMQEFRIEEDTLIVALPQRMTGNVQLSVTGVQDLPADGESFDLPLLEPLNVEREQGSVQLFAPESVEVTTSEDEVTAALPDPLGGRRPANLRASWRFSRRPVRIPVTITRKPARLSAQVATDVDVQPSRTRVITLVDFAVEYAGLETFRIDVPEAAMPTLQIEAVASDPTSPALRETTTAPPANGWVTHTLRMQRPVLGRQRFRVTYDLTPGEPVPADGAVDADEDAAGGGDADAAGDDADAADARDNAERTANPQAADEAAQAPAADDDVAAGGADDAAGDDAADDDKADDDEAGADDEATVPDVARQQTVIWIIRPLGTQAAGDAQATPLTSVTGEVRLDKEESLTITADATGADVEPIDVRELRLLPAQGTLAFRYRRHPADETIELTVTQERYDVREMLATVVTRGLIEIMLGEDEVATFRCRYRIKSTERQRLEISLPRGIVPLSVLVGDREVRLEPVAVGDEQRTDTFYVNVARSGESDEPFHLTLQYLLSFTEPPFDTGFMRGRIDVPLPVIGAADGSAATQELRTIVWVPEELALIGDPSGFELEGRTLLWSAVTGGPKQAFPSRNDDSWVGRSSSSLDFPTAGRTAYRYSNLGGQDRIKLLWWDTVRVTIVVSIALALIALLLLRTDWENKLGILLVLLLAAVLLGLKDMHVLAHALSAMRFGLLFMIGLWLLHAIFGHRPAAPVAASATTSSPAAPGVSSATPPHAAVVPPPGVFEHFLSRKSRRDDGFK
jgi:hypothetical protein